MQKNLRVFLPVPISVIEIFEWQTTFLLDGNQFVKRRRKFADNAKHALVEKEGLMGAALDCIKAYEHADWEKARCADLDERIIRDAYLDSVVSSREMMQAFLN